MKIIFEELKRVEKESRIVPEILNQNIKKVKDFYLIDDNDFCKALNITPTYCRSLLNNKINPSGQLIFKLLKKYNFTFSMLFDIAKEIEVEYYKKINTLVQIVETDIEESQNASKKTEFYSDVIAKSLENYDLENRKIKATYFRLEIKDNKFLIKNSKINFDLTKETLNEIIKLTDDNSNFKIETDKFYYMITTNIYEKDTATIEINTYNNLDVETNNKLISIPFRQMQTTTFNKNYYEILSNGTVKLKESFLIYRDNNFIKTDILNKNEFSIDDKNILYLRYFTDKKIKHKLKIYRLITGKTIYEMAELFDMTVASYRLLETEANIFSTKILWIIENILGILVENIIDIDEYFVD